MGDDGDRLARGSGGQAGCAMAAGEQQDGTPGAWRYGWDPRAKAPPGRWFAQRRTMLTLTGGGGQAVCRWTASPMTSGMLKPINGGTGQASIEVSANILRAPSYELTEGPLPVPPQRGGPLSCSTDDV
jgi:hypothetical protein